MARLPGTTGSDPGKISSAFHRGNGCDLLHSPESFTLKDLRQNSPTINLSRGVCAAGWRVTSTYFFRTRGLLLRKAACKDCGDQTVRVVLPS